jgi:hypothetical protein
VSAVGDTATLAFELNDAAPPGTWHGVEGKLTYASMTGDRWRSSFRFTYESPSRAWVELGRPELVL